MSDDVKDMLEKRNQVSSGQIIGGLILAGIGLIGCWVLGYCMSEATHGYVIGFEDSHMSTSTSTHYTKRRGRWRKRTSTSRSMKYPVSVKCDNGTVKTVDVPKEIYDEAEVGQRIDRDKGMFEDFRLSDEISEEIVEEYGEEE